MFESIRSDIINIIRKVETAFTILNNIWPGSLLKLFNINDQSILLYQKCNERINTLYSSFHQQIITQNMAYIISIRIHLLVRSNPEAEDNKIRKR